METLKSFLTFQARKSKKKIHHEKPQKNFLFFLKREFFLYSRKWKSLKNSLCFRKLKNLKNLLYFRKRNFLLFWERYIQNPRIFRTRSIFRTLTYLKPRTYSEHRQTARMEFFSKTAA